MSFTIFFSFEDDDFFAFTGLNEEGYKNLALILKKYNHLESFGITANGYFDTCDSEVVFEVVAYSKNSIKNLFFWLDKERRFSERYYKYFENIIQLEKFHYYGDSKLTS